MAAKERFEYHFADDRIISRRVHRPVGTKRWHYSLGCPTLIAVIEPRADSIYIRKGPAATDRLLVDAVRYHKGLLVDPEEVDIGPAVPLELATSLGKHIETAIERVLRQFSRFAEETDITGFLKGLLDRDDFTSGDWRAGLRSWTYSRRPKERDLGVDIGLLIDLIHEDRRVIKALWFQAKKATEQPSNVLDLPDLAAQLRKMRKQTDDAYALVYSPKDVLVYSSAAPTVGVAVQSIVADGIACRRGDRSPKVVALTGDAKLVVEMLVAGPTR